MATPFHSLALYPGGQGRCGIVFSNPGIAETSSIRKVTLPWSAVSPLIWNMQNWKVSLRAEIGASMTAYDSEVFNINEMVAAEGKFLSLYVYTQEYGQGEGLEALWYSLFSSALEPALRVCGDGRVREYAKYPQYYFSEFYLSDTTSNATRGTLLPPVSIVRENTSGTGNLPSSFTISESVDTSVGNFSLTWTHDPFGRDGSFTAVCTLQTVWVKTDGTCDLYFDLSYEHRFYESFGSRLGNLFGNEINGFILGYAEFTVSVPGASVTHPVGIPLFREMDPGGGGYQSIDTTKTSLRYTISNVTPWTY